MNSRTPLRLYAPIILAMIFWSYSFIWYKQAFIYYDPITLIVFRLILAVPMLFMLSLAFGKLQRIERRHMIWFLLLGFFEPFLYYLGECYGVALISPTLASIIISLIPLLAPIPARILFRERLSVINISGIFISIAGVVMVIMGESGRKPAALAGVLLMLLAVLSTIGHSIIVRKLIERYNTFTIVTYQTTFGLLYFIPLFCFLGLNKFIHMQHTVEMVWPVVKLALFASTFAFLLFVYTIQHLGVARTNVFVNLIPAFTAVISFLVLGETFNTVKIAGIFVVVSGLIFSQIQGKIPSLKKVE